MRTPTESEYKCKYHGKDLITFCQECNILMCNKCHSNHKDKGCKCPLDIITYAERYLAPRYKAQIDNFEISKEDMKVSINDFVGSSDVILKKVIQLKSITERLLKTLNACIFIIDTKEESKNLLVETMKVRIYDEFEELKASIKNEDTAYIIDKIKGRSVSNIIELGANDKRLIVFINNSMDTILETKQLETLDDYLQELNSKYQLLSNKQYLEVSKEYIYGICKPIDNCKKLCKFDIESKKLITSINIPQYCTVSQIGNRVFISGGYNPIINTASEYIEHSQSLVSIEPMRYHKYCHSVEFVSDQAFVAIGGYNSKSMAYCEQYFILENKWSLLPSLNIARHSSAPAFIGTRYLYAIGGYNSDNTIEVLNMAEKKSWEIIKLTLNNTDFRSNPIAIEISGTEILIFCGGDKTDTAIFDLKCNSVSKHNMFVKPDGYSFSGMCIIRRRGYIIGHNGHIHIYDIGRKHIEEVDCFAAIA